MKNILYLLLLHSVLSISYAQTLAIGSFNKIELEETFNSKDSFSTIYNYDNYFILDNGDFFLNRTTSNNELLIC